MEIGPGPIIESCTTSSNESILHNKSSTDIRFVLTQRALIIFCETYHIPDEVHPQLPSPNQTIHEMPSGKIGVYTRFFEYVNFRLPLSTFFVNILRYYRIHISQLSVIGAAKVSHFEVLCRVHGFEQTVVLFRCFYVNSKNKGWMSFKPFLCLVGISRYYTLDEDAYPEFLGMDLLAFIQTVDPTKVRVAERQRAEDEPRVLESTVGRDSGDGQDADVQPVAVTTNTIVEDVAPLQLRRQRKRKIVVADASGPSHLPKKLREDFGALGGVSKAGKSMAAVQSLFSRAMLEAEARGEPVPTLPFITSSVSTTLEREDRSHADSVPGPNLRTIGAPQRFVISSDSSHHSGANIAKAKVDSIIRSSASAIATVTTVTATIDTEATATRAPVAPSLFGVGSSLTGRSDSVPGGFFDVSGSDFLIGGIRTVVDPDSDLQKVYIPRWSATNGFGLDDSRLYREMEKRKLRAVVDEQAELLKTKDREIENLKAQFLLKEREKNELNVKVTDLSASVKVKEHEVADLDAQVTAIKLQNDNLVGQDEKLEEVNEKFDKLCADFVEMALHLEEKLYPHLLTTISGRQWLLTYGVKHAVAKCLNSTEYLSALGAAISKAVEKGMQEGLSAGITHGAKGRQLADVATYNPSAEADYLSALEHLQSVNFSLIAELKSKKDASVDTIMNLLRLDDVLAERLGLTESQPHVDQLMVPIHHSPDQRVIGASALTFSLEVSNSRVKKMRENIANHVSALRDMFVPLSEPLSATALEGMEGTFGSTPDVVATLSTTFVFASTIPPISTNDYEVAHADGQGDARVDDETAADDDMNLFVSNADLNISEYILCFLRTSVCYHSRV
uniref:Transposase (Putative), gypsy type n=1 Tax=Tanacetum cinerariifolium TaxID=118510 RepID=A0A699HPQ0_TANCI|nr:transposase (putative), gypsy type [Tanacetum cinerariifolium]